MKIKADNYIDSVTKSRSIKAFERLSTLMFKKNWKAGKLDDRGTPGLQKCIRVWLELNGFGCKTSNGNIIEAARRKETLIIEVAPDGYYSLTPSQKNIRDSVVKDGAIYLAVKNLADFLEKFDGLQLNDD